MQKQAMDNNVRAVHLGNDLPFAPSGALLCGRLDKRDSPVHQCRGSEFSKDYGVAIESGPLAGVTARAVVGAWK